MNRLKNFFKRIYRLSLSIEKQDDLVWQDLKRLHNDSDWKSGVYEKERTIETVFEIANGKAGVFFYMIYEGSYHCRVKVLDKFSDDVVTDLFILAAHFNNLLKNGKVLVNVENRHVEYHRKREILIPLLYDGELSVEMMDHYSVSRDIYSAFQRLVEEGEAPAIIIADLMRERMKKEPEN
jgi:hypothetical protein